MALEHLGERVLRRVADALRDLRRAQALTAHQIGRRVHAPAGHVARGRLAHELAEALEEARAREAHARAQLRGGPRAARLLVYERERAADDRILHRREPA